VLERLHDNACHRDKSGNRKLHFDQYAALILLYFFNPIVTSLRSIQQASELKKVQRILGCSRAALGSLSEAARVFDADLLRGVIGDLVDRLPPIQKNTALHEIKGVITLVDGSLLPALPKLIEAMWLDERNKAFKMHTHFELFKSIPVRMDLTDGNGNEREVLEKALAHGRVYVMDRGYAKFKLFNAIVATSSSYVCRIRDNSQPEILEERPLSDAAREANIVGDCLVQFGQTSKRSARPDHPIRLVTVKINPHTQRGKYKGGSTGPASDGLLRIATNLLDVPAEIIALIYKYRWTIETFFRFFKHLLGCRHLLSHHPKGIKIQTYCAIIACMLISLWTGHKPTKRTYEMICYYFIGLADEEELLAHLAKLKKSDG